MSDNLLVALVLLLCLATCDSCSDCRGNAQQLYCPAAAPTPRGGR